MLEDNFFNRDAQKVAQELLGKIVRHYYQGIWLSAMIIETEAYYLSEKASHASLGFTEKRKALFMPAGTIYMYHIHNGHSLNISCQGAGNAVLIKSGTPYFNLENKKQMLDLMHQLNPSKTGNKRSDEKLCAGQTLLCAALGLKVPEWDKQVFHPEKMRIDDVGYKPQKIIQTTRLGIPIGRDEHLPYRFIDFAHAAYCTKNPLTSRKKEYNVILL